MNDSDHVHVHVHVHVHEHDFEQTCRQVKCPSSFPSYVCSSMFRTLLLQSSSHWSLITHPSHVRLSLSLSDSFDSTQIIDTTRCHTVTGWRGTFASHRSRTVFARLRGARWVLVAVKAQTSHQHQHICDLAPCIILERILLHLSL